VNFVRGCGHVAILIWNGKTSEDFFGVVGGHIPHCNFSSMKCRHFNK
jgi:hypothetical protein